MNKKMSNMLTITFFIFLSFHRISFISLHFLLSFVPLDLYLSYHYSLPSFFLHFQHIMSENGTFIDRHNHLPFIPLPLQMLQCLILVCWECSYEHSSLPCYLHDVSSYHETNRNDCHKMSVLMFYVQFLISCIKLFNSPLNHSWFTF